MFPHEEYLLKAIQSCDFRMIGLVHDLGNVYIGEMAKRPECTDFAKALQIGKAIQKCADEIARIQGDDPVIGGHCQDIIM